jgi:hypothetical protein
MTCLAALVAVVGCGGGLTPEHQAAFTEIQRIGGKIDFSEGGYRVDLASTQVSDEDLKLLKHIANLKEVDLRDTLISDKALPHLQAITTLEFISLERCGMSRDAIEQLKKSMPDVNVMD